MKSIEDLAAALDAAYPELAAVREAAAAPVFLVGGAVRDLLLGRGRADIDLVVEGDAAELAARLGAEVVSHERFATAKAKLDGHEVDIAAARAETYPHPGSLPEVAPARLVDDLARRDFTINAMAIPLQGDAELIDPHGGERTSRTERCGSFTRAPSSTTRPGRCAPPATRPGSASSRSRRPPRCCAPTDLDTVSADRREAELLRLAAEPTAPRALELLAEWGLVEPREGGVELAAKVGELLSSPPWSEVARRDRAVLAAALGPAGAEASLAAARPEKPSEAVELARGKSGVELALARAMGAEWLDRYLSEWRSVSLEIDGEDLIAAGVPQGPAVGRGLAEALRRKLDGEISGRDEELATALEAAGGTDALA